MSIITYKGHAKRARQWYDQGEVYLGIGRTTPWDDETNPPNPSADGILEEPICYKKVEQKYYVLPDETGSIFYRGQKYRIIGEEEAIQANCRYIFISTWLNYGEAPVNVGYRQVGLFTGLVRSPEVQPGKYVLLPEEVEDEGTLECLVNDVVTYRSDAKRERLAILIEF